MGSTGDELIADFEMTAMTGAVERSPSVTILCVELGGFLVDEEAEDFDLVLDGRDVERRLS